MTTPLEATEAASVAVQKPGTRRVTLASIKAKIDGVDYHHPALAPEMTVAYVRLANGFIVIGRSAPADPANFNADLGRQFALEDALRQVWPLEGYLLREELWRLAKERREIPPDCWGLPGGPDLKPDSPHPYEAVPQKPHDDVAHCSDVEADLSAISGQTEA